MAAGAIGLGAGVRDLGPGEPTEIGEYRLRGVLGSGGMGSVYLGVDRAGDQVAVKVAHESLSRLPEFRARFEREVRVLRRVSGPFTARVLDASVDAVQPWLVMEYVPGPTLREAVEAGGAMPPGQVRALAIGLAAGLAAIHRVGVVHRDLKPDNIILAPSGPRIVDLGVAQIGGVTALTLTGQRIGTVAWMAPEQLAGQAETAATDVFAWALMVSLAASGEHPFGSGRPEVIGLRVATASPDLSSLNCPDPDLRRWVEEALAKDPESRPSAARLVSAFTGQPAGADTLIDDAATVVTAAWDCEADPLSATRSGPPPDRLQPEAGQEPHHVRRHGGRRRPALLVAAAVAVCLLGLTAVLATGWKGRADPDASGRRTSAPTTTPTSSPLASAPAMSAPAVAHSETTASARITSAGASPEAIEVFRPQPDKGRTLAKALAAARRESCSGCVDLGALARDEAQESARRGLVTLGVLDPDGGGAMEAWGYSGSEWWPLVGFQDDIALPTRLPSTVWICTDDSVTNIRSGPGTDYPVIAKASHDTRATATFMRATQPMFRGDGTEPPQNGEGWYLVTTKGQLGWVSSTRLATTESTYYDGCGLWEVQQQYS